MGNLNSSLSNRKNSQPILPISTESPDVQDAVINQRLDMPDVDREETAGLGQSATGKRKSLLNFSSLRKRQRTTEKSDNQIVESPHSSPSRPWRSGLGRSGVRPTSMLLPPSANLPARRPSSAILSSPASTGIKRKGKERDEGPITANTISSSNESSRIDDAPPMLNSELPVAEEEMPLSEQVLMELRNLQTDTSTKNNDATPPEGSNNTVSNIKEEEITNDWRNARPYTPPSTRAEPSSSLTQLSDTLGSWMGGIGRANETNSLPNTNEAEAATQPINDSDASPHSPPAPTSAANPVPEVSPSIIQNNPAGRRPLPPTGTGTIVVVQGVVHTADVRQSHQLSHQPPVSHRPPRPVSSTPTLRNLSHGPTTESPSLTRSTTPQPNPRRNRFSSLTNTLRQRSNSRTPTSSRTRNGNPLVEDVSDDSSRSQSVLSLGLDNPSSDSETSASLTGASSSVGAVVSTDDISTEELFYRRPRYDHPVDSSLNEPETRGRNSFADDDNDAELSPGSIEVLGTLLSVATAATAASLVSGTTEPLFQSGLTGPSGNRSTEDSLNGLPRSVNARPNTGTDRMRSAWDNLRDRFSRSRRRNFEGDPPMEGEDTREQMVREMARAFNLNLGRSSPEREEARPGSPDSTQMTSNTDAPEGSFERFLHNLQVDLRTALAEDYAARRSRGRARGSDTTNQENQVLDHPPTTSENRAESDTQNPVDSASNSYQPRSPRSVSIDLPVMPAAAESPGSEARPQATGVTGQPGAGINWWRLYRFPPMVMASSPSTMSNDIASSSNPTTVPTSIPSQTTQPPQPQPNRVDIARSGDILSHPTGSADQQDQSPRQEQPQPTQQHEQQQQQPPSDGPQQVVPVIVVGLQSVPINRNVPSEGNPFSEAEHAAGFPAEPTRGRSWPLRAASSASRAFSRMGRRNDDSLNENQSSNNDNMEARERHAGRTYLIFVIGGKEQRLLVSYRKNLTLIVTGLGYYPPNHGIVTGADDMNSFEALWELAELIGQVKPQVASKEDIEQSGLEVLKASRLSEYEGINKVASNTIERCLICLDDYEPDDDVRLLTCRHAFHRNCVDKWLEQGRNNCPACRSKGVTTNDEQRAPTVSS